MKNKDWLIKNTLKSGIKNFFKNQDVAWKREQETKIAKIQKMDKRSIFGENYKYVPPIAILEIIVKSVIIKRIQNPDASNLSIKQDVEVYIKNEEERVVNLLSDRERLEFNISPRLNQTSPHQQWNQRPMNRPLTNIGRQNTEWILKLEEQTKKQELLKLNSEYMQHKEIIEQLEEELFSAIESNDYSLMEKTLKKISDLKIKVRLEDAFNNSPFHSIIEKNNEELLKLFFQYRDMTDINNLNTQGRTALELAIIKGETNIVRLLLTFGANPNIKTAYDETAFSLAKNKEDILKILNEFKNKTKEDLELEQALELSKLVVQKEKTKPPNLNNINQDQTGMSEYFEQNETVQKENRNPQTPIEIFKKTNSKPYDNQINQYSKEQEKKDQEQKLPTKLKVLRRENELLMKEFMKLEQEVKEIQLKSLLKTENKENKKINDETEEKEPQSGSSRPDVSQISRQTINNPSFNTEFESDEEQDLLLEYNLDRGEETYYNTGQNWESSSQSSNLDQKDKVKKEKTKENMKELTF